MSRGPRAYLLARPAAALLALVLALAATAGCDEGGCRGTSFDSNICRSDLDCPASEVCSPGGVCTTGKGECAATSECPVMAPDRCADVNVACRGGACRYDRPCLRLGGRLEGLVGRGLVLANGDERLTLETDGSFEFTADQAYDAAYAVTVHSQPVDPRQVCLVLDGAGRFNVSDVASVRVVCAFLPEDPDGDRICTGEVLTDACINILDNCPDVYNPDQADRDFDGLGDACDPCTDRDGDGYGAPGLDQSGCANAGDDCDDADPDAHPGLVERCGDSVDNDCDGVTDELDCQEPYTAPVAVADAYDLEEDHPAIDLDVLDNDLVWDDPTARLRVTGTTAPSLGGTVALTPGGARVRYTPLSNANGVETFAYSVSDGVGGVSSATVTITLAPVNDPPTAGPDFFTVAEDSAPVVFDVMANDTTLPDVGETLSVIAVGQPAGGGVASLLLGNNVQYRPAPDFNGVETFTYILSDGHAGSTAVGLVTVTVTPVNDPPFVLAPAPDHVIDERAPWTWTVPGQTFEDIDAGDVLTLSATSAGGSALPAWLSFDPALALFSGTPTNADVGTAFITLTATDLAGATASDSFGVTVVNVNDPPFVANPIPDQLANEGSPWVYSVPADTFVDVDAGDSLSFLAARADGAPLPAWLDFDRVARVFSGTPANADVGLLELHVIATDLAGASVAALLRLVIKNVNQPPSLANPVPDVAATQGEPLSWVVPADTFSDDDPGDTLTYAIRRADGAPLPTWLTFDPEAAELHGTPANDDVGVLLLTLVATDLAGATAADVFSLTVADVNDPPQVLTPLPDLEVLEHAALVWAVPAHTFRDPDAGDALTLSAAGPDGAPLPAWLAFAPASGVLTGTPGQGDVGAHVIAITATDLAGASVTAAFTLTVVNVNDPPRVAAPLSDLATDQGALFTFTVPPATFTDPDPDDALTLSAALADGAPLPPWLAFDPATATLTGTPGNADVGALFIAITATDLAGASVSDLFALTVVDLNDPPVAVAPIPPLVATQDQPLVHVLPLAAFADPDVGDTLTWSVTLSTGAPLPPWLAFDPAARLLSGTPRNADVGVLTLRVTVTDLTGASASSDTTLTVLDVNDPPAATATLVPVSVLQGAPLSWPVPAGLFVDPDAGDILALSLTRADGAPLPAWLAFAPATGLLTGTPTNAHVGDLLLAVHATDLAGASASAVFTLTVVNTNDPPAVAAPMPDQAVTARSGFAFIVPTGTFVDPDVGDVLTFTAALDGEDDLPPWLSFDPAARVFLGLADDADVGAYPIRVVAIDSGGLATATVFTLTVLPADPGGDLAVQRLIPDQQATEGLPFDLTLAADTFTGGAGQRTLTAALAAGAPLPTWLSFDAAAARFTGTPTNADVGLLLVRVTATDDASASVSAVFALAVLDVNEPPRVLTPIPDQAAVEAQSFTFSVPAATFADDDPGDALALTASALVDGAPAPLPAWLTFYPVDPGGGLFLGTPSQADVGAVTVRVTATDRAGASVAAAFTLTVTNVNDPPYLAVAPVAPDATQDTPWSWTVPTATFADPDPGDALTLALAGAGGAPLPSWLAFDAATTTASGTPTNADVGATFLALTATDLAGASATVVFPLTVLDVPDPPVLAAPLEDRVVTAGASFAFAIPAGAFADPDAGDVLSLTAALDGGAPLPAWLTFTPASRALSGTPPAEALGPWSIAITAADTTDLTATGTFTLTVVAPGAGGLALAEPVPDLSAEQDAVFAFTFSEATFTGGLPPLGLTVDQVQSPDLPPWLTFAPPGPGEPGAGTLSGTPTNADVGPYYLRVVATDQAGATATDVFVLTVADVNDPPTVALALDDVVIFADAPWIRVLPAGLFVDIDAGDALTLSAASSGAPLPAWLTFYPETGLFVGTPGLADTGAHALEVTATDLAGASATATFTLDVRASALTALSGDHTGPALVAHHPADGGALASGDPIHLRFDEPLDPATVSASTLAVVDAALDPVSGVWAAPAEDVGAWVFFPDAPLVPGAHAVFIDAGLTDLAGNPFDPAAGLADFAFTVAPGFGGPAERPGLPAASYAVVDVAVAADAASDPPRAFALWLERVADNTLRLRARALDPVGAADAPVLDGPAFDLAATVAAGPARLVAAHATPASGDPGEHALFAIFTADDAILSVQGEGTGDSTLARVGTARPPSGGEAWVAHVSDAAGDVVAWLDHEPGVGAWLVARRRAAGVWGDVVRLSPAPVDGFAALDAVGGAAQVAWRSGGAVYRRHLAANGWRPAELVAAVPDAAALAFAAGPDGGAVLAWAAPDGAGGAWQIHTARAGDAAAAFALAAREASPASPSAAALAVAITVAPGGAAALAWAFADGGALVGGVDRHDGEAWAGPAAVDLDAAGVVAPAPLAAPLLVFGSGALADGEGGDGARSLVIGYGEGVGPELAVVDVPLAGALALTVTRCEPGYADAGAAPPPFDLGRVRVAPGGVDGGVAVASRLGVAVVAGDACAVVTARDAVFGADAVEAGHDADGDVSAAAAYLEDAGLVSVIAQRAGDVARVVAVGHGGGGHGGARAVVSVRGADDLGAVDAAARRPVVVSAGSGALVAARSSHALTFFGSAGSEGSGCSEPATLVSWRDAATGLWGAARAVVTPLGAWPASCEAGFDEVVGFDVGVDGFGRAVVAWRVAPTAGDLADVVLSVVDPATGEGARARLVATADGPAVPGADDVRLAVAGTSAALVFGDVAAGAPAGGRVFGVIGELGGLDGTGALGLQGVAWATSAALLPGVDVASPAASAASVAARADGSAAWLVAVVEGAEGDGAAGARLVGYGPGVGFGVTEVGLGEEGDALLGTLGRVVFIGGAARFGLVGEAADGEVVVEVWEEASPGGEVARVSRASLGADASADAVALGYAADGGAAAVWVSDDGFTSRLKVASLSPGGDFGAPVEVRAGATGALDRPWAAVSAGEALLVWREETAGGESALFWASRGPAGEELAQPAALSVPAEAEGVDAGATWLGGDPTTAMGLWTSYPGLAEPWFTLGLAPFVD